MNFAGQTWKKELLFHAFITNPTEFKVRQQLVIDFANILCASCDTILCDHFLIEIFALVMQIKRVHCLDVVGLNN